MVRHGSTGDNEKGVLRAWHDDPLSAEGIIDARMAAKVLEPYNPQMVYTSDLTRDTQTGFEIGKYFAIPSEPDYGLRTADMGQWTEMKEKDVLDGVLQWYQQPWKDSPSGESYNDFCDRFFTCFDGKLELSKLKALNPLIVVCHGRNFAALQSRYTGIDPWKAVMPKPGGVALIRDNGYNFPPYTMEFLTETEPILSDA